MTLFRYSVIVINSLMLVYFLRCLFLSDLGFCKFFSEYIILLGQRSTV